MNTGKKIYRYLKQIDTATGLPTGVIKENISGDPDYVPPIIDYVMCPIINWRPINPSCEIVMGCTRGYTLSDDGTICTVEEYSGVDFSAYPDTGCAPGWEYYIPIFGRPVCRRTVEQDPFAFNTGNVIYGQREKVVNNIVILTEDNIDGVGEGPYFPPTENLTMCPPDRA